MELIEGALISVKVTFCTLKIEFTTLSGDTPFSWVRAFCLPYQENAAENLEVRLVYGRLSWDLKREVSWKKK